MFHFVMSFSNWLFAGWITQALASTNSSSNPNILRIPRNNTYNLPSGFTGNTSQSFLQSSDLPSTSGSPSEALLKPFIVYDDEFASLLAPNASLELIYQDPDGQPIAHEMGIWVWDHNQVWMGSSTVDNSSYVYILDLSTNNVTLFQSTNGVPVLNPNGGSYHEGKVYIAGDGNATYPPSIYAVDPVTHEVEVVVNSYFGLRLNGPNDLVWATRRISNGSVSQSWLFFTDDPLSVLYNGGLSPQVPDATWCFDPVDQTLLPVIDRTDALVPNGIRVNKDSTKLYITNTPPSPLIYGAGDYISPSSGQIVYTGSESAAIYEFDLTDNVQPVNRRLFGIAERGIADGIHLDDQGRVWTGEADGIVVRSSTGKVLGMFNSLAIQGIPTVDSDSAPLANFALAGDRLIILAYDKIFQVGLSHSIVSEMT
jgi:gluconolactonase